MHSKVNQIITKVSESELGTLFKAAALRLPENELKKGFKVSAIGSGLCLAAEIGVFTLAHKLDMHRETPAHQQAIRQECFDETSGKWATAQSKAGRDHILVNKNDSAFIRDAEKLAAENIKADKGFWNFALSPLYAIFGGIGIGTSAFALTSIAMQVTKKNLGANSPDVQPK